MELKFKKALLPLASGITLTLFLCVAPQRHALWLWAWAMILVLPQPRWLVVSNTLLAALSGWYVIHPLGLGQSLVATTLLVSLMLVGLALGLDLRAQWQRVTRRSPLSRDARLWPGHRLANDLALETARCMREGSHGELLLVRSPRAHQAKLVHSLSESTRRFERCYQVDAHTLATVLIHANEDEAHARRGTLQTTLPKPCRLRFIALAPSLSLSCQLSALAKQQSATCVLEEAPDGPR